MSEQRCKTCEHFAYGAYEESQGYHHGTCQRIHETTDIVDDWRDRETLNKHLVFIHAIYENSYLEVSPDFGCVLWEERKADDE